MAGKQAAWAPPAYYVATRDIYLGHPDSGAMPIAAFRAGDQVPVEFVRAHQAEMAVRLPDGYPEPPSDSPAAEPPAEQPKVGGKE